MSVQQGDTATAERTVENSVAVLTVQYSENEDVEKKEESRRSAYGGV